MLDDADFETGWKDLSVDEHLALCPTNEGYQYARFVGKWRAMICTTCHRRIVVDERVYGPPVTVPGGAAEAAGDG